MMTDDPGTAVIVGTAIAGTSAVYGGVSAHQARLAGQAAAHQAENERQKQEREARRLLAREEGTRARAASLAAFRVQRAAAAGGGVRGTGLTGPLGIPGGYAGQGKTALGM